MEPPEPWRFSHGTAALEEIWTMGYRQLDDLTLQRPYVQLRILHLHTDYFDRAPEPTDILPNIQRVDKMIATRKTTLERMKFKTMARLNEATGQATSPSAKPDHPNVDGGKPHGSGAAPAEPSAAEKEKVFQKDEKLRELEGVSDNVLLDLLYQYVSTAKAYPLLASLTIRFQKPSPSLQQNWNRGR